jgi:signal transduction histidine kinase
MKGRTKKPIVEKLPVQLSQLRALAASLQAAREEERIRISREMHDGLGEMLTGIDLGLVLLANLLETKNVRCEEIDASLAELRALARETTGRVRKLCTQLRPSVLDDLGLISALEWQAGDFQKRSNIKCALELEELGPVPAELATAIFRIFQEVLTNVARHARASQINVNLKKYPSDLVLTVKDNGCGITTRDLAETKSLGLLGMQERAAMLGGTVEFLGEPGKGTEVIVRIPLTPPDPPAN